MSDAFSVVMSCILDFGFSIEPRGSDNTRNSLEVTQFFSFSRRMSCLGRRAGLKDKIRRQGKSWLQVGKIGNRAAKIN
jgi:hypothetical protein